MNKNLNEKNVQSGKDSAPKRSLTARILEDVEIVVSSACIVLLIFTFLFRLCSVNGNSMNQTLKNGDRLIVSSLPYTPKRGDIIVFHETGKYYNEPLVKRVIATGGEWLDINFETWEVRVADNDAMENAITIEEPYRYLDPSKIYHHKNIHIQIPDGFLFVMGDNRYNSSDSRSPSVGLVDERKVLGKVACRIYPVQAIEYNGN